ncbi:MAG: hypothetical protein P8X89_23480 [Reinekea sp.]
MTDYSFPNIDTSYWKIKDKAWMAARQQSWDEIEERIARGRLKPKKALNIIKRYYLKGILPDFEKLKDYQSDERHLDLLCFIWCHPSRDVDLLRALRDQYVHSPLLKMEDIWYGIGGIISEGTLTASAEYKTGKADTSGWRMYTGENEFLFDILIGDLTIANLPEQGGTWTFNKFRGSFDGLITIGKLLCNKRLNYINEDSLYQSDPQRAGSTTPLPCCSLGRRGDLDWGKRVYYKALYRLHNFDVEKEGDTCRSRIVTKFRKVLDEREFIPEFEQMWVDVKAGKVEVENPWER